MNCLIILSAVIVTVSCQWAAPRSGYSGDPSLARIISDQRAHHVAGDFRVAVKQEDGTNIEELATSADGTRRGSYSYINDLGQTESVKWIADRGGFRIINANNQPAHTQHTAAYKAAADNLARAHAVANARVAEAVRQAALNPRPVEQPRPAQRRPAPAQRYRPAPQVVSYTHQAPAPQQYAPVPQPIQQQQQYIPAAIPTTNPPKRFFPPGQLQFSRNQLGYNYHFSS